MARREEGWRGEQRCPRHGRDGTKAPTQEGAVGLGRGWAVSPITASLGTCHPGTCHRHHQPGTVVSRWLLGPTVLAVGHAGGGIFDCGGGGHCMCTKVITIPNL